MNRYLRCGAAGAAILLAVSPTAWAEPVPMMQQGECLVTPLVAAPDDINRRLLNLDAAQGFSRGEGQTVAVLDTGVAPSTRLPNLEGGGDLVADGNGLTDCDGHGTAVAGIIAGQPGPDGFSGVAPAAKILSIRLASTRYTPRTSGEDPAMARIVASISAMADAIRQAADKGARVIQVSPTVCLPVGSQVDLSALDAAVQYAAVEKDAVVIAAAGDLGGQGISSISECKANPLGNDAQAVSLSIPSSQPNVLSVGALDGTGRPVEFSMTGPWLGIAAPGQNVVSLSNTGTGDGLTSGLQGTSFAAAYVSGAAALVRSRFPDLRTATAHKGARAPSGQVGAGSVDPVAALTWELPVPTAAGDAHIAAPAPVAAKDNTGRNIAFAGSALLALAVIAAAALAHRRKERIQ